MCLVRTTDVLYLSGHYTPQGFVPDALCAPSTSRGRSQANAEANWRWRAAGHAAVIIPSDGPVTLVTDSAPRADSPAAADRIVIAADLIAAVTDTLAESMHGRTDPRRREPFQIAVIGGEALASRWMRALVDRLAPVGNIEIIEADDLAWEWRIVKSPAEQALLRAAGALGTRALTMAMESAVEGATEADVVAACVAEVIRGGGAWYGGGLSSAEFAYTFAPTGGAYGAAPNTRRRLELGD
ncbi:MAG: hypothetical protein JO061_12105, partial [Acidobacteriaceae bacterium]|nr:hypothetical protein [Acidobacteriaceae bacterium]